MSYPGHLNIDECALLAAVAAEIEVLRPFLLAARRQPSARLALRFALLSLGCQGHTPKQIEWLVEAGLRQGRKTYGPLSIRNDSHGRLWAVEASAEGRDKAIYLAAQVVGEAG